MAKYPKGVKKAYTPKLKQRRVRKRENPDVYVLRCLLQASPHYVSGNHLAEKLKMSRVGVWAHVDKLRKAGLSIEASQNRGYRLDGEPDLLVSPLLEAWLKECKTDCPFYLLQKTDSTNSEAERLLAEGVGTPFAVLSHQQDSGRGRMGRTWHSPKGGNLYLSIALRPNVELVKFRNFTLWQGISIGKYLKDLTGIQNLLVKWPNDLICDNKKLGGMLTEASIDCDQVRSIVFGIGLNVNSKLGDFPKDLRDDSTSLLAASGISWRLHELAAKLIKTCLVASKECLGKDADNKLLKEWKEMDYLKGKKIKVQSGKETYTGRADGIDHSGGLRLKLRNGRGRVDHAGEVSLLL